MYLTDTFSSFTVSKKRSVLKTFDPISRSFDESILLHLKALKSTSPPPSISLDWLSSAVDFLSTVHAEARKLISDLKLTFVHDSLSLYFDYSVKILDVCNSISSEIERLRHRRLLINFVLHLLEYPTPAKIQRAKASLSDLENCTEKRTIKENIEILIRDMAVGDRLAIAPRGKISANEKLVRRITYAVRAVTVFFAGVILSAVYGSPEIVSVRVPAEFAWAEEFSELESAICGELGWRIVEGKKRLLDEYDDVEACLRRVSDVIGEEAENAALRKAVKELETVTESFSEGLDRLSNGVKVLFHTVLGARNGMLDHLRVAEEPSLMLT